MPTQPGPVDGRGDAGEPDHGLLHAVTESARDAIVWLREYAERLRFDEDLVAFADGTQPSVLRAGWDGEDPFLFIGQVDLDSSSHAETHEKLRKSVGSFRGLVERGLVRGGRVVVVAASQEDADAWAATLGGIVRALGWKTVAFAVRNIDGHWVAIW